MELTLSEESGNVGEGGAASGGWMEYFPGQPYSHVDRRAILVKELIQSLQQPQSHQHRLPKVIRQGNTLFLPVNVDFLSRASLLPEDFFVALATKPDDAIACLGAAVYDTSFDAEMNDNPSGAHPTRIHVRIFNFAESLLALKSLKVAAIDKLISVRGAVIRMGIVKPMVLSMSFTCSKCRDVGEQAFKDGKYSPPTKCRRGNCQGKTFRQDTRTAKLIDFQTIRIQEILGPDVHGDGRMPRDVDCECREDLVDSCVTGDVVMVCGFVRAILLTDSTGRKAKYNDGLSSLQIEALSVVNSKDAEKETTQGAIEERGPGPMHALGFGALDLEFVLTFVEESGPRLFRNVLHSICPSIYGHELVKAGIALALFGGVQQNPDDDDKVPTRGDIHVLIVGDPGLGKSQLLKAASAIAQRGVYVCGNTSTDAGLTVTVVKDAATGDFVFEAGAMVLADGGVWCIDEFDKLSGQHKALLESMEQQCVSIAKAGIVASLPARTSVLAAANPVGGRYDLSKTVKENLKLSTALLSRFDLVFILVDRPDGTLDRQLTEHVLALHAGSEERRRRARETFLGAASSTQLGGWRIPSLARRLRFDRRERGEFEPLPPQLLRKYIAYARQYVRPKLSQEAARVLKEFYLRSRERNCNGTPITTRQLESLVRLAEARAKIELREEITEQDALDVVDIVKESSFEDHFVEEYRSSSFGLRRGSSHKEEAKRFLDALERLSHKKKDSLISAADLYSVADDIGLRVKNLDTFVANLNLAGYLLKKGYGKYQVQPLSCRDVLDGAGS